jgi:Mg2+/citrate symporter
VLLGIILLFSSVSNIIIVALIVAILLSAILFRKQIAQQKEVLNQGANESLASTITTGSTITFGSIATSVPAFKGVFQVIQSIPGPPVLSLMIGTGLIGGITASAVGAIGISVANFAPIYLEMGLDPETVHRAIAIGSGALSIVPYGEEPGNSQVAKLVNNMILGINMNAVAEGLKLAKYYGLPQVEVVSLLKVSTGDSWVARNWSDVSEWTADTALAVLLKDLKAAYNEGLKHNVTLPFNALSSTQLFDSMGKEKPKA